MVLNEIPSETEHVPQSFAPCIPDVFFLIDMSPEQTIQRQA